MNSRTVTASPVRGKVTIPGSKSQTIRALLIASMARGRSIISNPLSSGDTLSCLQACRQMGADITMEDDAWIADGIGAPVDGSEERPLVIDVGNSGTTLYLGLGLAAALGRKILFTGDGQIRSRPLGDLTSSLKDLGAYCELPVGGQTLKEFSLSPACREGSAPCIIQGPLKGGSTVISCPTSQYLSGLLLACPLGEGQSIIEVPLLHERPYAEMTLRWLDDQGISYTREDFSRFTIPGGQSYQGFHKHIAGDFSSASFFFCAAAVTGCTLTVAGLDRHDAQGDREILTCLKQMGCRIAWEDDHTVSISGPGRGKLRAVELDLNGIPDTLPVLSVTAAFAQGTSILYNVPQARIKETDRIAVMCRELKKLGADIKEQEDGLVIRGKGMGLTGGKVEGHGDHRVIMALAVGALAASGDIIIDDPGPAEITFPDFFSILESITKGVQP